MYFDTLPIKIKQSIDYDSNSSGIAYFRTGWYNDICLTVTIWRLS